MTRRDLAAIAALGTSAAAQPAPAPPKEDLNANAKAQIRGIGAALDKFPLPMAQEPAFQFKA